MVFVDASALVAMIASEPQADQLSDRVGKGGLFFTSPIAVYEAVLAIARLSDGDTSRASSDVRAFLDRGAISVTPVDIEHAEGAVDAFQRFGKGRHKAKLNMGDCFAYAVAKSRNASILFVGDDFTHTDIRDALAGL
ncbi:MAG: type II toxin-antitoxin system VapC family toxin [Bosea sp. (in: a-proteobacteria)]